jgi:hypothetical protein
MDGTTARRMAEQVGRKAPALTVEQLKVRLELGTMRVDGRTVIFVTRSATTSAPSGLTRPQSSTPATGPN